jgi:hypothetical protein
LRRISATSVSTAAVAWCGHEFGRWDRSASPATPRPDSGPPSHAPTVGTSRPQLPHSPSRWPEQPAPHQDVAPPPTTQPAPIPASLVHDALRNVVNKRRPNAASVKHHPRQDTPAGSWLLS